MINTNSNIDFSIIIVNYNSFSLLDACLLSIKEQNFDFNYEIIVIDNASTEGEVEVITRKYLNVTLIKNSENIGFAKANNQGVDIAKGEYVLLLNNDTEFISNPIPEIINYIVKSDKPIIGATKLLNKDLTFQPSAYKFPTIFRLLSSNFFLESIFKSYQSFNKYYLGIENLTVPQKVDSVIGAFMILKKEIFCQLKGFDENFFFYHEDTDLCYRITQLGGDVIYFPHLSLIHIGGGSTNRIKWFQLKNKVIARYKFFYKHHSKPYYLLVAVIERFGSILRSIIYLIIGGITFKMEKIKLSGYYFKTLFLTKCSK